MPIKSNQKQEEEWLIERIAREKEEIIDKARTLPDWLRESLAREQAAARDEADE